MSRYKGFKGELSFEKLINLKFPYYQVYQGGIIISMDSSSSSLNSAIYFCVVKEDEDILIYREIFKKLKEINFLQMYLVTYSNSNWTKSLVMNFKDEQILLPVPQIKTYQFDFTTSDFINGYNGINPVIENFTQYPIRKRNIYAIEPSSQEWLMKNLIDYSKSQLLQLYLSRLVLDGYIGFGRKKGKSSDIDIILKSSNGDFRLIEVKEKDLTKGLVKGFGLDVPRIHDLNRIANTTGLKYYLAIRHINNQLERNLVGWKKISIKTFSENVKNAKTVEGGTGMRSSHSSNPTLICPLDAFDDL